MKKFVRNILLAIVIVGALLLFGEPWVQKSIRTVLMLSGLFAWFYVLSSQELRSEFFGSTWREKTEERRESEKERGTV